MWGEGLMKGKRKGEISKRRVLEVAAAPGVGTHCGVLEVAAAPGVGTHCGVLEVAAAPKHHAESPNCHGAKT